MLDLVVRGGLVAMQSGPQLLDIGVQDGVIVALRASDAAEPLTGARIVDATDRVVVPGGVDPHVHTSSPMPTLGDHLSSYGPDRVSVAAAFGGTTTMLDFAHWHPGDHLSDSFARKDKDWKGISYVDYGFHGTFREPEIPFEVLDQVAEQVAEGHATWKVWMTNTTPYRKWQKTDIGHIWGLMERTAAAGAMLCVHAEDDDIVMYSYKRLEREGRTDLTHMSEAHNQLSELLSFQRVIALARHVGAPIYIMHVSAEVGVEEIRRARGAGQPVYGECLPHYAAYSDEAYGRPNGAMYHTYPSLKAPDDRAAMWSALADGTLSTIATDSVCVDLDIKTTGKTIVDAVGGHVGVEVRMAIAYTEAVTRRGLPLERFVDLTSRNAAKVMGAYPQKGEIAIGSDADLVLLDVSAPHVITASELHEADYTPWEGYEATAWPVLTMVRGRVLVEDGRLTEEPPQGLLLKRALGADVRNRPAL
ncbi:dihydropyrimidinase [Nocardioides ginsengisoli]|uniref:Amidohydrolase family protein n=1 Tax=Nocardioides ginsengisoli TaxID=363868 RepID=A0ABW3VVD8_9ACTN